MVAAILRLETGDPADKGWTIELSADRGGLGPNSVVVLRATTDANGVVTAIFHAPLDTGWVHITAATFGAKAADSIHVTTPPKTSP
jgi:hypothetical protein